MSGDAIGELKIKVDVELDESDAKAQYERVADGAKKELDDAAKASDDAWNDVFSAIGSMAKWAFAAASAAAAVFIGDTVQSALTIDRQSESLGMSRREIQQWQYVAEQAGVEAENFAQAVAGLSQRAVNAAQNGGEAARQFSRLGVELRDSAGNIRPTNDLMLDVADALAALPEGAERTNAAMALFGEQGRLLLPVLSRGREGVSELTGEFDALGGGLTDETIDAITESDRAFKRLHTELKTALQPMVKWLADFATKLARNFRTWATDTSVLRVSMSLFAAGVAFLARQFVLLKAEAVATWLATFGPVLLGAAAIALLVLFVDDLITLFEGGDSIIGEFIDSLFGVGTAAEVVESLKAAWNGLVETITKAIDAVKEFVGYDSDIATNQGGDSATRVRVMNGIAARGAGPAPTVTAPAASGRRARVTASATQTAAADAARRGAGPTTVNQRRQVTINGLVSEQQLRPMIDDILSRAMGDEAAGDLDALAVTR